MKNSLNNDSAVGRGVRTLVQVLVAIFMAIVQVPGVPEAVYKVLQDNSIVSVPVLTGIVSLVWNLLRRDVKNV